MTYRPRPNPRDETIDFSSRKVRLLTVVALVGYPIGAAVGAYSDQLAEPVRAVGALLRVIGVAAMLLVAASSLAELVTARKQKSLDEFQLRVRHAAMAKAFAGLSAFVGLAAVYTLLALDWALPLPGSQKALQSISIYFLLLILVLPTASLAWSSDASLVQPDEEEE